MRAWQLLPLLLLAVPLLAVTAAAANIEIQASCDSSGVYISVTSDTPFAYTLKWNGNIVDAGQAQSSYTTTRTEPGTYTLVVTPTDGSAGKWASISYDGSACSCTGASCVNGGDAGSGIDLGCSGWCNGENVVCKMPGLGWICDLVCNLCRIINGLKAAIEGIASFFEGLISTVKSFGNMIISGINTIGDFFASIGDAVIGFFSGVASRVTGFVSALSSFFGSLANAVYSFFAGLWNLITAPFRALIDKISGGLSSLGSSGMTWRQYLFIIGTALMVGGAFASGRGRILLAVGAIIVAYVMFSDPQFIYGIMKSPYLVIAAGAFLLVYAALRLRE